MDKLERRLKLHEELCEVLGSRKVYFQPPESVKLSYPCIIYQLSNANVLYADNKKYMKHDRYSVTLIDKDPDSSIRDGLEELDYCSFERYFTSDNLNHYVYLVYI